MKRNFLLISVLIFFSLTTYSQHLKLNDLLKLRAMDVDEINDFLLLKGWKFIKTEKNQTQWAYGKGLNKASYWFSLFKIDDMDIEKSYYNYANDFEGNYIVYQSSYTNTLSSLKAELIKSGFKKTNTTSKSNNIKTEYESNNYKVVINFKNGTEEYDYNENNFYTIELHKRITLAKRKAKFKAEKSEDINYFDKYKVSNVTILRPNPDGTGEPIIQVPSNSFVELLDLNTKKNKFWYVTYNGYRGYINRLALSDD
jgi:hypothetical protein